MARNNAIIAALDIGTQSVTTLIAQKEENGLFSVIGKGVSENKGLIAGDVVDVQATASAIRDSVTEAENISSKRVKKVFVGVSGEGIRSINSHGVIQVRGQEVAKTDVIRVIDNAKDLTMLPDDSEIISVEIGKYSVDGKAGIVNPIGMACRKLEVDVLIITMPKTMCRNLYKAVEDAGFFVNGVVVNAIASSWAVLEEDEKNLGVAIVDIGDGVSDIAIYHDGDPVYVAVMPMGGKSVTDDISKVMKIPPSEAEKIKCKYGNSRPEYVSDTEVFDTVMIGTNAPTTKKVKQLATVITPRIEEILIDVKKKLRESRKESLIQSDIVLTGGTAKLKNIQCVAEDALEQTVRIGMPKIDDADRGFNDVLSSPTFATAVGIIRHFSGRRQLEIAKKNGWLAKIADIFRNFFE